MDFYWDEANNRVAIFFTANFFYESFMLRFMLQKRSHPVPEPAEACSQVHSRSNAPPRAPPPRPATHGPSSALNSLGYSAVSSDLLLVMNCHFSAELGDLSSQLSVYQFG